MHEKTLYLKASLKKKEIKQDVFEKSIPIISLYSLQGFYGQCFSLKVFIIFIWFPL